jgi:hypothetical protein
MHAAYSLGQDVMRQELQPISSNGSAFTQVSPQAIVPLVAVSVPFTATTHINAFAPAEPVRLMLAAVAVDPCAVKLAVPWND